MLLKFCFPSFHYRTLIFIMGKNRKSKNNYFEVPAVFSVWPVCVCVCVLDVTAGWSAWMKSLFVQCYLTESVYPDPNVTSLRVRFISSLGSDKFDFGTLTFYPQSRRSSCLCRWGRCFAGRWWNRAEPNRTELGRLNVNDCWRKPRWDDVYVDSNPFTGESRAGVGKRWVLTGPL